MKLIQLTVVVLGVGFLGACGNFVTDFGIPTVQIAPAGQDTKTTPDANGNPVITQLDVKYSIRSLPGSNAAVIYALNLQGGGTLPGGEVLECSASTAPSDCPVATYTFSYFTPNFPGKGSVIVVSYEAVSNNGQSRTVNLPKPITLY